MTNETSRESVWCVRHLVELAFDLSQTAEEIVVAEQPIADGPLFDLWQAARDISDDWQRRVQRLDDYREANWARTWCDDLARLGHEVLAAEALLRVWGSLLVAQDKQRGTPSAQPIIDHVVTSVQYARVKTLELVVHAGDAGAAVDRFRRRCERWTDVLIGPVLARHGVALYAHDARSAWEFGEEQLSESTQDGANQLLQAGFRSAFRDTGLDESLAGTWSPALNAIFDGCPQEVQDQQLFHWRRHDIVPLAPWEGSMRLDHLDDEDGWSLLARCLRMAELRKQAEE
jgi:hypothetical protein